MDRFFVKLLLLDEAELIGISLLIVIVGGFVGSFLLNVKTQFRRITYLWFLAGLNLALLVAQFGWALVPSAAETEGMLSVLVFVMLSSFGLFGAALYYASAARSNDINGSTQSAWLGFVPFANLWLLFKRGRVIEHSDASQRSVMARFVADPLLVIGALFLMMLTQGLSKTFEETAMYDINDSASLRYLVVESQTLEESFATEAAASSRELPMRVDEITVFQAIEAEGATLRMTYDVEQDIQGFNPGFKGILARQYCAPELFGADIARGGRIVISYRGPNGQIIEEYEITQADCQA